MVVHRIRLSTFPVGLCKDTQSMCLQPTDHQETLRLKSFGVGSVSCVTGLEAYVISLT